MRHCIYCIIVRKGTVTIFGPRGCGFSDLKSDGKGGYYCPKCNWKSPPHFKAQLERLGLKPPEEEKDYGHRTDPSN